MDTLAKYQYIFTKLKRGSTKMGPAPHKPVFLLTLIDLIERGMITQNQVLIDADLVATFQSMWQQYVTTDHRADFTQPFYHLQNDNAQGQPFWFVKTYHGLLEAPIKSINKLAETITYGYLGEELFLLMQDPVSRAQLQETLINHYFPEKEKQLRYNSDSYYESLENYILNDAPQPRLKIKLQKEEEYFVRNGLFKKHIPRVYQNTCCFTGMQITGPKVNSMVDACHIIPFSQTLDDRITNGLALSPTMHRALDQGLITVDEKYRMVVSNAFDESTNADHGLKKLHGRTMLLPKDKRHFPSQENLEWHRKKVFRG